MIHFVGAGPGAVDLITVRGMELIKSADVIIYAGSLVNPGLLAYARKDAEIHNSACMTLEEICAVMQKADEEGRQVVRLHTGDASIYGAVREQMDMLAALHIPYDSCPGVSACFGAAAGLNLEYTLPDVTQTLIITRLEGKTPVPDAEKLERLASHGASMAIYLSAGMLAELSEKLVCGGYSPDTPAALVYKATWPEEKQFLCTVGTLAETGEKNGITKTAIVLVGDALAHTDFGKSHGMRPCTASVSPAHKEYGRSRLYDPAWSTEFRTASRKE